MSEGRVEWVRELLCKRVIESVSSFSSSEEIVDFTVETLLRTDPDARVLDELHFDHAQNWSLRAGSSSRRVTPVAGLDDDLFCEAECGESVQSLRLLGLLIVHGARINHLDFVTALGDPKVALLILTLSSESEARGYEPLLSPDAFHVPGTRSPLLCVGNPVGDGSEKLRNRMLLLNTSDGNADFRHHAFHWSFTPPRLPTASKLRHGTLLL